VPSPFDRASLFPSLPDGLRNALFEHFNQIVRNFRERRWEPSELNGGKFCEVVYSILKGHVDGVFPSVPSKPRNMVEACRRLEQAPASFSRSLRIQIPRILIALYEIRSNRGVGHVGSDVDPNHMDAIAVLYMSKWVMAEIIRIFHSVDTKTATAAVETVIDITIPIIWEVNGKHRVLKTDLSMPDKTLLLLYKLHSAVSESDLVSWVEHSNPSVFRRDILRKLHNKRLIEYNESNRTATISPAGIAFVDESINLEP
jgi:hypothetical protein